MSIADESASKTIDGARSIAATIGFVVMIASYCINAMDRTLFPLILSDVRREYGFNLQQAGLMSTIFTLGMALAGLPTGFLMARTSRKTVMQIGILIYSVGTIVTVLARSEADMLFYRAVTGIGEAMQLTALLAIFASYFQRFKAAAVGCLNIAYALGAALGPALGTGLLVSYATWRAPMIAFGVLGLAMMLVVALAVRPWLSEAASRRSTVPTMVGGATTVQNPNTIILTILSILFGLMLYGYLGMYPTFLREELHFAPTDIGRVMSLYGLGVLVSIASGWLGDRFSPRLVLPVSFLVAAAITFAIFNGPTRGVLAQASLSCALGMAFSGTLFVNLAGYAVKAVGGAMAGRASGIFVTSLYGAATIAGYLIGWLASLVGWTQAGNIQLVLPCLIGAALSLALRPAQMATRTA